MPKKIESIGSYVDINKLVPWEDNPRINIHAIDKVASSIKRFGFASPIICRKQDYSIIAGHTRYAAAKKLNLDKVPVRLLDLDPVEARLLAIADNKIGELADWDEGKLLQVIEENSLSEDDLLLSGFTGIELESILNESVYNDDLINVDFDDVKEPEQAPVIICPHCGNDINEEVNNQDVE